MACKEKKGHIAVTIEGGSWETDDHNHTIARISITLQFWFWFLIVMTVYFRENYTHDRGVAEHGMKM